MSQLQIYELVDQATPHIEEILDNLGVKLRKVGSNELRGRCEIHGGGNNSALVIYINDSPKAGYWCCFSGNCQEQYGSNIIGLIKGILSTQAGKRISFDAAVEYLYTFLGYKSLDEIKIPDGATLERRKFVYATQKLSIKPIEDKIVASRKLARSRLTIPSLYYIARGFDPKILDRYDVGDYNEDRVSVPVYNRTYTGIVGYVMRSRHEKCLKCDLYHNPNEECPIDPQYYAKWIKTSFNCSAYLYNYWFAKSYIEKTKIAILVEGVGDVLKLEQNGIHNSVAMFGTRFSTAQESLLNGLGIHSIVVMLDNDEAGLNASRILHQQLKRRHRLYFPTITSKDAGDLHSDEITKNVKPFIEKIENSLTYLNNIL